MIASLSFNESGVSGFGVLTDLNREEAGKIFLDFSPLSSEEVLEIYSKLKKPSIKVHELLDNDTSIL